eukprot:3046168-Karenia_brevis.AAC.1
MRSANVILHVAGMRVSCVQWPKSTIALSNILPVMESVAYAKYGCSAKPSVLMVKSLYTCHRVL